MVFIAAMCCRVLYCPIRPSCGVVFFFFNDTATTEIYTLSLHDALPISSASIVGLPRESRISLATTSTMELMFFSDRKSTRLNSSHGYISYAVFCLKKKTCIACERSIGTLNAEDQRCSTVTSFT